MIGRRSRGRRWVMNRRNWLRRRFLPSTKESFHVSDCGILCEQIVRNIHAGLVLQIRDCRRCQEISEAEEVPCFVVLQVFGFEGEGFADDLEAVGGLFLGCHESWKSLEEG